jgi:hypothetical protein
MNKTILLISLVALLLPFQVRAADTGRVSEIFACTFKEGKDWEDFNRINDKFAEMLDKIGGDANNFNAFVWQPYRGSVEFTYLWAAYYDNLQALADSWQAITDAGMDEEVNELWGELETCISGRLQPGKSLDDVASAVTIWQQHVNAVGLPFDVYMRTPIVSGSDYTHSYFVTHADASAYGANMSAWRTHPDTAAIDAMLSEVQVCQTALWQSWQVQSAE